MNIYGRTKCPECKEYNSMFRPLPLTLLWDETQCYQCDTVYYHSIQLEKKEGIVYDI